MDDIKVNQNPKLGSMDRPNSYIGRSLPRESAKKHLEGGGQFVDDLVLPRMLHVAFLRSPFAHAEIKSINVEEAKTSPGVFDVYTAKEIDEYCTPWVGTLGHLGEMRSPEQTPLAKKVARWQGEPIAVVIANNRAQAEDALELIEVDWEEKDAQVDMETALDDNAVVIHPELGSNLFWTRTVNQGDVNQAFETSHAVVETTLDFARHTGVTLESRGIVADWNKSEGKITIYHNGQAPHMMQHIIAKHLEVNEGLVRIVSRDVGGSFGIKVHVYPDEMAVAAISKKLGRPIKFIADRLESFTTDIHARCHKISGKLGVDKEGKILAMEINDLSGIGPFSMYPRTSAIETNQVLNLSGAPYIIPNYKAVGTVVFQNKTPMCQYRAVGHPIAVAITEALVDKAATKIGINLHEIRKKNFIPDNAYPNKTPSGEPLEDLSHQASMDKLLGMMNIAEIEKQKEDFGQTLAVYGINSGPYLVLPFLGPSTVRDAIGKVAGIVGDPVTLALNREGKEDWLWIGTALKGVDFREQNLEKIDNLEATSVDFYATIRSLYLERRNRMIRNQSSDEQDPFKDFDLDLPLASLPSPLVAPCFILELGSIAIGSLAAFGVSGASSPCIYLFIIWVFSFLFFSF